MAIMRGRPRKPDAITPAERQKKYRLARQTGDRIQIRVVIDRTSHEALKREAQARGIKLGALLDVLATVLAETNH